MRAVNARAAVLAALELGDGTASEITVRLGLPVETVRWELRRLCELGCARALLVGDAAPVYRLLDGITMAGVRRAEAKVADMASSGRKAA